MLKQIEKALAKTPVQRFIYLVLLVVCLYLYSSNGVLYQLEVRTFTGIQVLAVAAVPLVLLLALLIWNRRWLWRIACFLMIMFTCWLATLSLPDLVAGAGASALVWAVGVVGFTGLLILLLTFINWMLLHMKPKK